MANYILKDAKLWWEGYDLSGRLTSINLPLTQEAKDDTRFSSSTARTFVPGLKSHSLTYAGFHDNATVLNPDKYIEAEIGSADTIVTVSCDGGDLSENAWSLYCATSEYTPLDGDVGDVTAFNLDATGTGKVFRGIIMQKGQETGGGVGTAVEITGMDEGDVAYMAIHCTELDATTLSVEVYSDTVVTFDNARTLRDFGTDAFTEVGAQICTFTAPAGITTHDCWRIEWGLAGGNTTATFAVNLYIP